MTCTYIKLVSILLCFIDISGCSYNIKGEHFNAEVDEGFLRSFVVTCPKANGKELTDQCKITLCTGYSGVISDTMKSAAVVAGAYFIGQGLGDSGDTSSSTTRINNGSNSSSVANPSVNVGASANAASLSGASIHTSPAMQPKPHHYRELKPHEHGYYGID